MESYQSKIEILFTAVFPTGPKAFKETQSTGMSDLSVSDGNRRTISERKLNTSKENEYVLSAEYLQEEAYHGSSISHKFAQFLLWSFVSVLVTPILFTLSHFHSSDYFWVAATCVIFAIVILISCFHHDEQQLEEAYTTAWESKTISVQKIIQDRIYAKDRNTKFRTSHLAKVHRLQTIPENQHPKSLSNMRLDLSEKYTAAMKDMTSKTRIMLNIYLIISGAMSTMFILAAYHFHNTSHYHLDEIMSSTKLVTLGVAVMVMYLRLLHKTKFWIEELERERRAIKKGWNLVD
ncbi:hypothetical protein SBOR_9561 [Sclerotinia borealis F-4128]|uniref:Uncharacterized protein n=1 Tax=Sclerotinia borealis (strain F-4128) TaxID=1432307 RepID=W9BZQ2_SCLBF|nr:hypothetical protein SBOR_9561 [Sclerotinia borealis F-4128]